jgi:alanyl-tRNA synthetase
MTADQIRQAYLDFFKEREHSVIPPAPLVLENDPTTLFTSSGMQPLVPYLKGEAHPMGTRLVNSQPSFRAEDIEEVGDNRHTTFFEMLGNWSLGDYFKAEQLPWFFEFLTQKVGLETSRLYVTVFEGDEVVPRDEESIKIWQELFKSSEPAKLGEEGFDPKVKIYTYPATKNWWSRAGTPEQMPVGEIGGPDSEVFFDFDPQGEKQYHKNSVWKDEACHVNCDCGRFLEIGNSVFMQYIKTENGGFEPLPKQNVDFGGGLERIAAAAKNEPDVFKIDLLWPLIEETENLTGKKYEGESLAPMRVMADHIRAASFIILAGVEPSNKQQGYILRRLLRRSAVKLHQLSKELKPGEVLAEMGAKVLAIYNGTDGVSLNEQEREVRSVISKEMERFAKTLDKGLKEMEKAGDDKLNGELAFNLFQSYGFPLEITQELAVERGTAIDEAEFQEHYSKHKELSKQASKGMFQGGLADHSETVVKYHTATHLLHQALREVLGQEATQMGSNITGERLRFDFKWGGKLTEEEKEKVEAIMNQKIEENLPVHKTIETKEEALAGGALAFFKETYPEQVSVYTIGTDPKNNWYSKELCGGPHVASTGEIGPVKIIKEQAVGANVRRLYVKLAS